MKYTEVLHQRYHLQGFTTDGTHLYWSFTDSLVKTTMSGTVVGQVPTATRTEHLGGIDYDNGKIYGAAMGNSLAGQPWGMWSSFTVHVYDAATLAVVDILRLDDCYEEIRQRTDGFDGIGCITAGVDPVTGADCLMLGCGTLDAPEYASQIILQYGFDGKRQNRYVIPTGVANIGVQNIDRDPETGSYWMTTYSREKPFHNEETLYCVSPDLTHVTASYVYSTPYGFHCLGGGRFYASLQDGVNGHRIGYAYETDLAFIAATSEKKLGEHGMNEVIYPLFDKTIGL